MDINTKVKLDEALVSNHNRFEFGTIAPDSIQLYVGRGKELVDVTLKLEDFIIYGEPSPEHCYAKFTGGKVMLMTAKEFKKYKENKCA